MASSLEKDLPDIFAPSHKKLKKDPRCAKAKSDSSKSAKTKAKLSLLPSLPLDVLFEIFGHLPPLDILNMARATKDLRRVLMHRSAISIWKASLRQIRGLPECPQDMEEPAWVNLAFSPFCHNCFSRRVQKVDWFLRIRLCEQCLKSSTHPLRSDKHLDTLANKLDKIVSQCLPFSSTFHIRGHKGKCCVAAEERKFLKDLQAMEGDRSEFVKNRKKAIEARAEHAAQCEAWMRSLNQDRWDELEEIREKRRADIADKLEDLGFIEELEYLQGFEGAYRRITPTLLSFDDHPDVKVTKALTTRSWKNMEQRLIKYMHEVKAHRLAADRLCIVREREKLAVSSWIQFRLGFSAERLLPSGADILSWNKVKAIIELPSCVPTKCRDPEAAAPGSKGDGAEDENPQFISPASFTRVFRSMSSFISQWEAKKISVLRRLTNVDEDIPFSFLPTLDASEYSSTRRVMAFIQLCSTPEFFHHPCTTVARREPGDDTDAPFNPLLEASNGLPYCRRKEWSTDSLFFDEKASRAVKKILEACGWDYRVVTTEDMDILDPWFICLKCSYGANATDKDLGRSCHGGTL
ncbi:hypothetical protein DFH09DRAFT_1500942 [Mycena vulgaris]|nr:hypothetical protein DFH09DRAFT_1500942 [Mycena vulgaris]